MDLAKDMDDMCGLVIDADPLKMLENNENQKEILKAMSQQTLECAYFIHSYASSSRRMSLLAMSFLHGYS